MWYCRVLVCARWQLGPIISPTSRSVSGNKASASSSDRNMQGVFPRACSAAVVACLLHLCICFLPTHRQPSLAWVILYWFAGEHFSFYSTCVPCVVLHVLDILHLHASATVSPSRQTSRMTDSASDPTHHHRYSICVTRVVQRCYRSVIFDTQRAHYFGWKHSRGQYDLLH